MINVGFQVYQASAGSGKTFQLALRYLKICLSPESTGSFTRVLAITFTNKAALEMKERVLSSLTDISKKKESGTSKFLLEALEKELNLSVGEIRTRCADLLTQLLHNYSRFSMQTIDSFTQRIVQSFAQDLKLPLNFETELDGNLVLELAAQKLLENQLTDANLNKLLKQFASLKFEEGKSLKLVDELVELGKDLLKEQQLGLVQALNSWNLTEAEKELKAARAERRIFFQELNSIGESLEKIFTENNLGPNEIHGKKTGGVYGFLKGLARINNSSDFLLKPNMLKQTEKGSYIHKDCKDEFPGVDELIDAQMNKVLEFYPLKPRMMLVEAMIAQYYKLMLISHMARALLEVYEDHRMLHISEFNKLIAEYLKNQPAAFIYERIGERYHHYFLDEFQDTSELQWNNLMPLVENALASAGSSLLVGDAKQGIYRWRAGSSDQFVKIAQSEKGYQMQDRAHPVIRIDQQDGFTNTNYRSAKTVVDFNNGLFLACADTFQDQQVKQLYKESAQASISTEPGYVEVNCLGGEKDHKEHLDPWLLESIEKSLEVGYKPCDIAILVRTQKQGQTIVNCLVNNNIKVVSADSVSLLQNKQVQHVMHVLAWVENAKDAIKSLAVYQDLLELGKASLFEKPYNNESKELVQAVADVLPLETWRKMSLLPLLESICFELDLDTATNPFLIGLLNLAYKFGSQSLEKDSFIFNLEQKNPSVELPEDPDAVQVVTIHKSKGLEYKVVLFPLLAALKIRTAASYWIDMNKEMSAPKLDLAYSKVDAYPAFIQEQMHEHATADQLDALNLLYVACTRARNALFIATADATNSEKLIANWVNRYADVKAGEAQNFGTLACPEEEIQLETADKLQPSAHKLRWESRLRIAKSYQKLFGPKQQRFFGTLLHYVMEKLDFQKPIGESLKQLELDGLITIEESKQLKPLVGQILLHPELKSYYNGQGYERRECSFLNTSGTIVRPDLVVEHEDEIVVIDYKTGAPNDKNKRQIVSYVQDLAQQTSKSVKGILIYVNSDNLKLEQYGN